MEYKIYLFNDDNLQDVEFDLPSLQSIMANNNCDIERFCCLKNTTSNFEKTLSEKGNIILFCKNEEIDDVICKNISSLSNQKQIIDEQVVCFDKTGDKIIFIPFDVDWQNLIKKINLNPKRANKSCEFKLFGISKDKVLLELKNLSQEFDNLSFSVVSKGRLLVDVYISYPGSEDLIDNCQVKIASTFKNYVYSENSLGLSQSILQLLRIKGLKLSICEGITGGALIKEVCQNEGVKEIILNCQVKFLNNEISPDNVYKQTLTLFDGQDKDVFAINVQGDYQNGILNCVYAIGNSKSIDVYKDKFKVSKAKATEYALDAIMFNIVKKLRQNSLVF